MRILIVDDEAPARAKVRRYLAEEEGVEVVGEATSGREAVAKIEELAPDLVLLDVQMPELDGFGVIDEVGVERMPYVVFVTAFDEHAIKAFEVRALDYLLKPFTPERFEAVMDHARTELSKKADQSDGGDLATRLDKLVESLARKPRPLRRILVHHGEKAFLVPVERIDRIEAERNYVRLHTGGASYLVRSSIGSIAERLDPARFLRINRSDIVRLDAVKEMHPWFHGDYRVVLLDGTRLMWSRRYRAKTEGEFG